MTSDKHRDQDITGEKKSSDLNSQISITRTLPPDQDL